MGYDSPTPTQPDYDTTPAPSALTTTRRTRLLPFTCEVPFHSVNLLSRKSKFPKQDGHFRAPIPTHTPPAVKHPG